MPLPLERKLENKSVDHAETAGWMTLKMDKVKRAWPDELFLGPRGVKFIVEFKRLGEEPREQQLKRHRELMALGHKVYVVDTFNDFLRVFEYHSGQIGASLPLDLLSSS